MKLGIATVSISGNLTEKIEAIARAGFDGIEIFEQDFIADAAGAREVSRRIRGAGLDILLFQPFRDFEGLPKGKFFTSKIKALKNRLKIRQINEVLNFA